MEWVEDYDSILSKRDVVDAMPCPLAKELRLEKGMSAGASLETAVRICDESNSGLTNLAHVYSKLATKIWRERNRTESNIGGSKVGHCKILFLAANPSATSKLDLDIEIREIRSKIRESEHRGSMKLVGRWAVQPSDIAVALQEVKPHVVHFSGHGSGQEGLILHNQTESPQPVSADAIVELLSLIHI